eukprot:jgi/Psemu1/325615/estExt_fgenesh1_pg.C_2600016
MTTATATTSTTRVWWQPWRIALGLFCFFLMVWAPEAVINRYWIREAWDSVLPGFGDSDLRKFTMRSHLTLGALALFCAPIQIVTPFVRGWRNTIGVDGVRQTNWYRVLHRNSGRIYIACAILSYVCGQWFIVLKEFRLVGGYNMGVAFSLAGFVIAYFAYMAWKTAPTRNSLGDITPKNNNGYTIEDHRNYAIRSFSQIIAPLLYRIDYLILMVYQMYRTPYMLTNDPRGETLVCNEHNICNDYCRPLDVIMCWVYWMGPWAVAELVIIYLPKHRTASTVPEGETTPLMEQDGSSSKTTTTEDVGEPSLGNHHTKRSVWVLNVLGCFALGVALLGTAPILIGVLSKKFLA